MQEGRSPRRLREPKGTAGGTKQGRGARGGRGVGRGGRGGEEARMLWTGTVGHRRCSSRINEDAARLRGCKQNGVRGWKLCRVEVLGTQGSAGAARAAGSSSRALGTAADQIKHGLRQRQVGGLPLPPSLPLGIQQGTLASWPWHHIVVAASVVSSAKAAASGAARPAIEASRAVPQVTTTQGSTQPPWP